jgi:hypothetical protein
VQLGGKYEKPASSVASQSSKSSSSSVALREGGRDGAGNAALTHKDAKSGKENRENRAMPEQEQALAATSSGKGPGAPKGSLNGKKPPAISTEASVEINSRSPLNLIRSWEKHDTAAAGASIKGDGADVPRKGAAKVGAAKRGGRDRGSSEEDDSTDVTGASASEPPTPKTPAGGYAAVLDSVRDEIKQAESVMAQVTTTFGVDRFVFPPPSNRPSRHRPLARCVRVLSFFNMARSPDPRLARQQNLSPTKHGRS